ncbi:hypothetical protein HAP94_13290 [Acidithiobacillus ferrivorans]|nr:hypothetical protein [Acidithiobacillus ferrivorans]
MELLHRKPLAFFTAGIAFLMVGLLPQNIAAFGIGASEVTIILALAYAADQNTPAITVIWSSLRDAVKLLPAVLIFSLSLLSFGILFAQLAPARNLVAHHPAILPWSHLAWWWRYWFINTSMDQAASAFPWAGCMIYATISIGYPGVNRLFYLSFLAFSVNPTPFSALMICGIAPNLMNSVAPHTRQPLVVLLCIITYVIFILAESLAIYLFCREVFDGRGKNKAVEKAPVQNTSPMVPAQG